MYNPGSDLLLLVESFLRSGLFLKFAGGSAFGGRWDCRVGLGVIL